MNRLPKVLTIITLCLIVGIAYLQCNPNNQSKIINFSPSKLSDSVPSDTMVTKEVFDDSDAQVETAALDSTKPVASIIHEVLSKLPNVSAKKIEGEQAKSVFSGSLSFCTTFNTYKPYIIEDSSWLIFEGDEFITQAREFEFSDSSQANSFAVEATKWADLFYTLPRSTWDRSNVNCWPNHTDKFYAVIHKGNRVMIIGDGDQYNYLFEAGDAIKDYHQKHHTKFYQFLVQLEE